MGNNVGALRIEIVRMSVARMMGRKLCCAKDTFQLVLVVFVVIDEDMSRTYIHSFIVLVLVNKSIESIFIMHPILIHTSPFSHMCWWKDFYWKKNAKIEFSPFVGVGVGFVLAILLWVYGGRKEAQSSVLIVWKLYQTIYKSTLFSVSIRTLLMLRLFVLFFVINLTSKFFRPSNGFSIGKRSTSNVHKSLEKPLRRILGSK